VGLALIVGCSSPSTGAPSGSSSGSSPVDAGGSNTPPSCAASGPGLSSCGKAAESCCASSSVPAGTYDRTYFSGDAGTSADPATISTFWLDKYDVTVARFRQFVAVAVPADGGLGWRPAAGAGKHVHLNGGKGLLNVGPTDAGVANELGWSSADDANISPTTANLACSTLSTWTAAPGSREGLPINCVNWWEAYAFCIWDGGFLPSEAEWEFAAAGGSQQRLYPWGATAPGTGNQYAIYNCDYPNGSGACTDVSSIAPVGTPTLGTGLWGQLDLAGEMWQWTADWYKPAYVDPCVDCASLTGGSSRILRGGSYLDDSSNLLPTYRNANDPQIRNDFIGVRCARSGAP
jgi:sulfatase modifying factor 1